MKSISTDIIKNYRKNTFRTEPIHHLKNLDDAINYVNERGFVFFWPIQNLFFPSLWTATAGDRPVAEKHDDPGHITWRWKDSMLGSKDWYYAKALRKKACMISKQLLPNFYALTNNYGSPEEDHIILYEQGRITQEARHIYQAILDGGPLDTIALKKASNLSKPESESRFNKAMADLQTDFKILPIAVSEAGPWRYAFIYEITARHYPDLLEKCAYIDEKSAIAQLSECYLRALGAEKIQTIHKFFQWNIDSLHSGLNQLRDNKLIHEGFCVEDDVQSVIIHRDLLAC